NALGRVRIEWITARLQRREGRKTVDGSGAGLGRRGRLGAERAHRLGAGSAGGPASDRANSLERRTSFSGGRTAGEQTAGLCWAGRFVFDVRVTLVSIS